jgi:hypothetical protein
MTVDNNLQRGLEAPQRPAVRRDRVGLLAALDSVDQDGWDSQAGRTLLLYVRDDVVRPVVVAVGLRGAVADQAEATGWSAAWEVLTSPGLRTVDSPWGVLWVAVRRAVLGDVVAGTFATSQRSAWRLAHADNAERRPRLVSLSTLIDTGREPPNDAWLEAPRPGPLLDLVVEALAAAGWEVGKARTVVEAVAASATRDGKASSDAQGWRRVAAHLGIPPWQVRRVTIVLLGAPGWPGLVERVACRGPGVLEEPEAMAALRSTAVSWLPSPASAARRAAACRGRGPVDAS